MALQHWSLDTQKIMTMLTQPEEARELNPPS